MSFAVFADGTANLPGKYLDGISLLPCPYTVDGVPGTYDGNLDRFNARSFYDGLRNGKELKTALLNTQLFIDNFTPILEAGTDIIYISMSSGISGTYNAAWTAAKELRRRFKDRYVHVVDSLGCGFGSGLLAIKAAELSRNGADSRAAANVLDAEAPHICQYFTVDDIGFLKKTGRVSGFTAKIATALSIKPILYGDSSGHIVSCSKTVGRKKAIEALAEKYRVKHTEPVRTKVFISHGDCMDDAKKLALMIKEITPEASVAVYPHEPFSGAHVGPGMLGLFFHGTER
ncbi:MAG: DegV family protein [Clostridia bacterium]|nr:DegV family protein [Clostridia bacterium]